MAMTFNQAINMLTWRSKAMLDRFTVLQPRSANSVQINYRSHAAMAIERDNSYILFTPSLTGFRNPTTMPRLKKIVALQQKFSPADISVVNNMFAVRMRPGRGEYITIDNAAVCIDSYGAVAYPTSPWEYDSFCPPQKDTLDCLPGKEFVLSRIVRGDDGERLRKPVGLTEDDILVDENGYELEVSE